MTLSLRTGDGLRFLSALQLADGTFPAGRYTLSHGLESFVQEDRIRDGEELRELLTDYVRLYVGPTDCVATATAVRLLRDGDLDTLVDADLVLLSLKSAREAATSSQRTGHGLIRLTTSLVDNDLVGRYAQRVRASSAPGNYAIIFGLLAGVLGLDEKQAAAVELYSFLAGLLGVAMRILAVDHTFAQQTLQQLAPVMEDTAVWAAGTDYHEMGAYTPLVDLMQMRHELAHVRLFGS